MEYRYDHFSRALLMEDFRFQGGVEPGDPMPDFDLATTAGGRIRKSDFIGRRPVLFVTGSLTCPMTSTAAPLLKQLYRRFGDRVKFVLLYVREAHPGENCPQAESLEEKIACAREYQERDEIPWTVAVDDLDGEFHSTLDDKPNSAHIMNEEGTVVFRALWANDMGAMAEGVRAAAEGRRPRRPERLPHLVPMVRGAGDMYQRLSESGSVARRDVLREAPPMYAMAAIANLFRPLPPLARGMAAMAVMGIGMVGLAAIGAAAIRKVRNYRT